MMYDMMSVPPKPGTPLESLMLLIWRARQDIEVLRTKVLVQAILASGELGTPDHLQKAWDVYLDEVFPFKKGLREQADKAAIKYLESIAQKGPMKVTPLQPLTRAKSKIRKRTKKEQ